MSPLSYGGKIPVSKDKTCAKLWGRGMQRVGGGEEHETCNELRSHVLRYSPDIFTPNKFFSVAGFLLCWPGVSAVTHVYHRAVGSIPTETSVERTGDLSDSLESGAAAQGSGAPALASSGVLTRPSFSLPGLVNRGFAEEGFFLSLTSAALFPGIVPVPIGTPGSFFLSQLALLGLENSDDHLLAQMQSSTFWHAVFGEFDVPQPRLYSVVRPRDFVQQGEVAAVGRDSASVSGAALKLKNEKEGAELAGKNCFAVVADNGAEFRAWAASSGEGGDASGEALLEVHTVFEMAERAAKQATHLSGLTFVVRACGGTTNVSPSDHGSTPDAERGSSDSSVVRRFRLVTMLHTSPGAKESSSKPHRSSVYPDHVGGTVGSSRPRAQQLGLFEVVSVSPRDAGRDDRLPRSLPQTDTEDPFPKLRAQLAGVHAERFPNLPQITWDIQHKL